VSIGGKFPKKIREIPQSVSVITAARIDDQKLTTVGEALGTATGITVIPNEGSNSQYKSRGFQLNAMYDGVPTLSGLSGYQQMDVAIYERIEILRGPSGLLQGSGEAAGTVNLVSKRGHDEFEAAVGATVGSWQNHRVTAEVGGPLGPGRSVLGRAVVAIDDRDDFVDFAHYSRRTVYSSLDWRLDDSTVASLSFGVQDDRAQAGYSGNPAWTDGQQLDVPRSTNLAQTWNRHAVDTANIAGELRHEFTDGWSITARVRQSDQRDFFRDSLAEQGVRVSDRTVPYGRRELRTTYKRAGVDLFAARTLTAFGRSHSILLGYNWEEFNSKFEGVSLRSATSVIRVPLEHPEWVPPLDAPYNSGGETEREQRGLYMQVRAGLAKRLTLVAGARLSDVGIRSRSVPPGTLSQWRDDGTKDGQFTPSTALIFEVTPWASIYASSAEIFTPQSALQVSGRPLQPRTGEQVEVGAKLEMLEGRLNISTAIFQVRELHRALSDLANPGFWVDAGEVESKGWELEVIGSPAPSFELQLGYSRLDSRLVVAPPGQQGDRFSALEPRHSWRAWATRRIDAGLFEGLSFGAGVSMQSGIEFDPPRIQGGYTVANVMAGYRLSQRMNLAFNANNIFDKTYYTRLGGTNSYNTFGPPRNYKVSLSTSF
jgi:outer membrane receptor for ferric coprogen and ferric-rhodotorulic acid